MADPDPDAAVTAPSSAGDPPTRIDNPSYGQPILLTLPTSDFATSSSTNNGPNTSSSTNSNAEPLLLLQLPPKSDLTLDDLSSGRAYIVGPSTDDHDNNSSDPSDSQACLVIEGSSATTNGSGGGSKGLGCSYALSKVETSNALVMVPPQTASRIANSSEGADEEGESPPKKQKTATEGAEGTEKKVQWEMAAQLLEPGGSGASFLDVRPHPLHVGQLRKLLRSTQYDPYSRRTTGSNAEGKTIGQLAALLKVSQSQIRHALTDPRGALFDEAFELPRPNRGRYGILSDEAREDGSMGIVSVLAECEEYAATFTTGGDGSIVSSKVGKPVDVKEFVQQVVTRSVEAEGDGAAGLDEVVVEHCLRWCASSAEGSTANTNGDAVTVALDLDKIALILAHHLFNRQTVPWEIEQFQSEWQRLMPCVGELSKPDMELLAGVALRRKREELSPSVLRAIDEKKGSSGNIDSGNTDGEDAKGMVEGGEEVYLTYLPEDRLSTSVEKRFEMLFREKERWTATELRPYVQRLADEAGSSVEEMLLKNTLSVDVDGIKVHTKR